MRILILSIDGRIADYFEFAKALASFGVEAICLQSSKYCYLETRPLNIVPSPRFLKLIKRFDPDFVLTDSSYYVPQMAKLVGRRLLLHLRCNPWNELNFDGAMHPSFFVRMYNRYLAATAERSFREVDLILPNSKWLEKQVREHLQNRPSQVLYVGIDPKNWDPRKNTRSSTTLNLEHPAVVGVFPFNQYAKVSGLLKFIQAIRKMKDVNFYFAGNGPYLSLVRQKCPSNMFLIGKATENEVQSLLESGDLFIHPSGSDALPRSVKEASLM